MEINLLEKIYNQKQSEYLSNNPTWHEEDSPWKAKQIERLLSRNTLNLSTVAEVGCGAGEILNQLHAKLNPDIIFSGYDISPDAHEIAKKKTKDRLMFFHENFLEKSVSFDLLLMMDVFEHVEDYFGFIKNCSKKANYKIFHIPLDISVSSVLRNEIINGRKSVGHIHYFMKDTALSTLKDCDLEIIDYIYTSGAVELSNRKFKTRLLNIPRRFFFKICPDLCVRVFGGYSILVLAR